MKTSLSILAVALMAGGAMFAQPRVSVGIGFGGYAPGYYAAPPAYAYAPPCPGPDYTWVDGYWGPRNVWVGGFWRAPFAGYRVAPRYVAPYYNSYRGYDRDRFDHDRGRGWDNRYQNRGGERYENRGRYSNGFRR